MFEKINALVSELNGDYFEITKDEHIVPFSIHSLGFSYCVKYLGLGIWAPDQELFDTFEEAEKYIMSEVKRINKLLMKFNKKISKK